MTCLENEPLCESGDHHCGRRCEKDCPFVLSLYLHRSAAKAPINISVTFRLAEFGGYEEPPATTYVNETHMKEPAPRFSWLCVFRVPLRRTENVGRARHCCGYDCAIAHIRLRRITKSNSRRTPCSTRPKKT